MQAGLPSSGQTPGDKPTRFEGFDVLGQAHAWDPVTAGTVLGRLAPMPPIRFFDPAQEAVARPMLDLLLDQREEPRVPVFEMIDQRLAELTTDGWHYEDMPPDPDAWLASLEALDQDAFTHHGRGFAECDELEQTKVMQGVADLASGSLPGDSWHGMPASRVWSLWTRYACSAFYSHPWVWNEIGFPGPAYPRGYKHPGINTLEPFEVPDRHPTDPTEGQL